MVKEAIAGKLDWKAKRAEKLAPVKLNAIEQMMAFTSSMAVVAARPARTTRRRCSRCAACRSRRQGPRRGAPHRGEVLRQGGDTPQATALVGLFLADQAVKKAPAAGRRRRQGDQAGRRARRRHHGGGIAYQSASKGTPIIMKDIARRRSTRAERGRQAAREAGREGKITPSR